MNTENLLREVYFSGGDPRFFYCRLYGSAGNLLRKTNASRVARSLSIALSHVKHVLISDETLELHGAVQELVLDNYRPIADDVLFIAAYELYGKARLLESGCAVHKIKCPDSLRRRQKKEPISFADLSTNGNRLASVDLDHTLPVSWLFEHSYNAVIGLPSVHSDEFRAINIKRNGIHFFRGGIVDLRPETFDAIAWLAEAIQSKECTGGARE